MLSSKVRRSWFHRSVEHTKPNRLPPLSRVSCTRVISSWRARGQKLPKLASKASLDSSRLKAIFGDVLVAGIDTGQGEGVKARPVQELQVLVPGSQGLGLLGDAQIQRDGVARLAQDLLAPHIEEMAIDAKCTLVA